jgi:hypothetical protein
MASRHHGPRSERRSGFAVQSGEASPADDERTLPIAVRAAKVDQPGAVRRFGMARGQLGNPSPQGHARRSNFATRSSISPVSCALRHVSTKLATPAASPGVISPLATLATSAANTANIHHYQSVVLAQLRGFSIRLSSVSAYRLRRDSPKASDNRIWVIS